MDWVFEHDANGNFVDAPDLIWHWSYSAVFFTCFCGQGLFLVPGDGGVVRCRCGRLYRLSVHIEVDATAIGSKEAAE